MKVAIYARVSTEEQASHGYSIEGQVESLKNYCKAKGWEWHKKYIDAGYSAKDINRPSYQELFNDIKHWDAILVYKIDRIHRSSRNFGEMFELLKKDSKEFVSVMESLDTSTAMGRFVMDIIVRIAQLESEQIGERTKFGQVRKAQLAPAHPNNSGRSALISGPPPYGFKLENNELVVDRNKSIVVKKVFRYYLKDLSITKIAEKLNQEGITGPSGKRWNRVGVWRILKNSLYKGTLRWDSYNKQIFESPPIIKRNEFDRVQKKLSKNRRGYRK